MKEILKTLGWSPTYFNMFLLSVTMVLGIILWNTIFLILINLLEYSFLVHVIMWGIWFAWMGYFFPKSRQTLTEYRQAFFVHILPGVSFGVSMMSHPFLHGMVQDHLSISMLNFSSFSILFILGFYILYEGIKTIGLDGAGFLYEYINRKECQVKLEGIYTKIRHPLFLEQL